MGDRVLGVRWLLRSCSGNGRGIVTCSMNEKGLGGEGEGIAILYVFYHVFESTVYGRSQRPPRNVACTEAAEGFPSTN